MLIQTYIHKALKAIHLRISFIYWTTYTHMIFWLNSVKCGRQLRAFGRAKINVSIGGKARIGERFCIRTGLFYTEVGGIGSRLLVGPKGVLTIGNNVGMSNTTIFAEESVTIGNNVIIGGGVQIFDTNFHSTDPAIRTGGQETRNDVKTAPIIIGDNVFIGTNSIICKGVSIGDNAIIAAGSVVVRSIPANEVWGGNPAKRIK
jgi:acetyltransferase-like isoleucine patch superfamily enzyme